MWELDTDYNTFYKQLNKSATPEFFLELLSDITSQLTMKVLGFEAGAAFSEFGRLILQDGSSFALHQALAERFPGRFNAVSPAAVELHRTLDLLQDAPIVISLSPDTDSEHAYRPEPESLRGDLLLADRGYLDLTYLQDIDRHGGFFLMRSKAGLNPRVIDAYREDGQRINSCHDRLHIQMLRQGLKTGDDEAQQPLESETHRATNTASARRQAFQQQALNQLTRFIRDQLLLEAIDKLTATVFALVILFTVVNVTIFLIPGGHTAWTDLSNDHTHGELPVLSQRFEPP